MGMGITEEVTQTRKKEEDEHLIKNGYLFKWSSDHSASYYFNTQQNMKVKELISVLSLEDPEMRVVVNGYESGFDEPNNILLVQIVKNTNSVHKSWEGEWDEVYDKENNKQTETALLIPRKS